MKIEDLDITNELVKNKEFIKIIRIVNTSNAKEMAEVIENSESIIIREKVNRNTVDSLFGGGHIEVTILVPFKNIKMFNSTKEVEK